MPKKGITTSKDLAGNKNKDDSLPDAPEVTPLVIQDEGLAAVVESAKSSKKGASHVQTFDPAPTERPTNCYREKTPDGDFIWWATEDGREIGRKAIKDVNEQTQIGTLKGYELDIPFDVKVAQKVQELGGRKVKFYRKDGTSRAGVSFEDFIKDE